MFNQLETVIRHKMIDGRRSWCPSPPRVWNFFTYCKFNKYPIKTPICLQRTKRL